MAAPKRTPFQREFDYERITAMYLKGMYQSDIAAELGLSQGQISNDIKIIQKRWQSQTSLNLDEAKSKELARIDILEREFWQAWETSKSERTKARQESTGKKDKETGKAIIDKSFMEKEQRDGNPAFLQGVLNCIDRRCKLLGIDAAIKTESRNYDIDLSKLSDEQLDRVAAGEDVMKVIIDGYIASNQSAS